MSIQRCTGGVALVKVMLTLVATLVMVGTGAAAERAKSAADATVFVRVVGSVHADIEEAGLKRAIDLDHIELDTGSGFVISPYGYVITNDHVVGNSDVGFNIGARKVRLRLKVSSIRICFPPEALAVRGLSLPCFEASVTASDPTLDLAVLLIGASNLSYVAFGDSDAVSAGLPVEALGYPFGREVDVGRGATAPDLAPEVSTTPGTISAMRGGDLQISNAVNPGNSGGPVVDRDGFAVGVIQKRLERGTGGEVATGIGFAIPINRVKDFLEAHSLDQFMPVRRLRAGPFQSADAKEIGLRLPEGLADTSPFRTRVETDAQSVGIALRIDRVLSPWNPKQLEEALVGTQAFERISTLSRESQVSSRLGGAPLLLGQAKGIAGNNDQEIRMDYAILDLGAEKLVARYVAPAERIAFNESVLRQSLSSLEGQRYVVAELVPVEKLEWSTQTAANGQKGLPVPAGWVVEPSGPSPCPGLPQPSMVATAFPARDFTIALRVAVWSAGDVLPDAAASACSAVRGPQGGASYTSGGEWLGVSYVVEGIFIPIGPRQVMQLEVMSPNQKRAFAHTLLAVSIKKATE
jgi:S1-C subfamily serine protease